jgi:uncharacterized protein YegP (UPF0339 family)
MGQLVRVAILCATVAAVMTASGFTTVAPAQDKTKKEQKDKDVKKAQPKEPIGVTEVYKAKDGWRIRVKNAEGKSIAIGVIGHEKKEDALKTIDIIKTTLTKGKVVEIDGGK